VTEITPLFAGTARSVLEHPAHDFQKEMLFVNPSFIVIYVRQIFDFLLFRSNKMHYRMWEMIQDGQKGAVNSCTALREWE